MTRGEEGSSEDKKVIKLDFSGQFPKYDVMEELGIDPLDLADMTKLTPHLRNKL